jgi:hypothetical protein
MAKYGKVEYIGRDDHIHVRSVGRRYTTLRDLFELADYILAFENTIRGTDITNIDLV